MKTRTFTASIILGLIGICVGLSLLIASDFKQRQSTSPLKFGVTFSQKYAEELKLDWRDTYQAITKQLGISDVRLMSYWDRHEPSRDTYDFSELDWMLDVAQQRGIKVSLAIGLRQPRWPECHQAEWTKTLANTEFDAELIEYLEAIIKRYRYHPALVSWQLENEAGNQLFGQCPKFDSALYRQEFDLVRALDAQNDLITTVSNQHGVPISGPVGDKVGFSIYRHATPRVGNSNFYWSYWYVPSLWHSLRAAAVEALHDSRVFVHELQAEPWGRLATLDLPPAEQDELMNTQILANNIDYALEAGFREIYLWGAEWWYWRQTKTGDPALWQAAQSIFRNN